MINPQSLLLHTSTFARRVIIRRRNRTSTDDRRLWLDQTAERNRAPPFARLYRRHCETGKRWANHDYLHLRDSPRQLTILGNNKYLHYTRRYYLIRSRRCRFSISTYSPHDHRCVCVRVCGVIAICEKQRQCA